MYLSQQHTNWRGRGGQREKMYCECCFFCWDTLLSIVPPCLLYTRRVMGKRHKTRTGVGKRKVGKMSLAYSVTFLKEICVRKQHTTFNKGGGKKNPRTAKPRTPLPYLQGIFTVLALVSWTLLSRGRGCAVGGRQAALSRTPCVSAVPHERLQTFVAPNQEGTVRAAAWDSLQALRAHASAHQAAI